eukprot:jgi/Botrbrau1/10872/Bobra.0025s0049.1
MWLFLHLHVIYTLSIPRFAEGLNKQTQKVSFKLRTVVKSRSCGTCWYEVL